MPYGSGIGRTNQRSRGMRRRAFVATILAAGASLAAAGSLVAQSDAGTPAVIRKGDDMTDTAPQTGYAPVNGLQMYYEVHGSGDVPLLLVHAAFSNIETDF